MGKARSQQKEIIKLRKEINKIEMIQSIKKINRTKSWFCKKINKIDKPLVRLIKKKKKKERAQINKARNERRN